MHLNNVIARRLVEVEEPVLIMFWRAKTTEEEFIDRNDDEESHDENAWVKMLSKVFKEVKDKINVIAADVNTEIGRRYAILLGVNPNEIQLKAKFRILKVDRQKSQSGKYALNIPSERVTHKDIVEFVGRYLKGDL